MPNNILETIDKLDFFNSLSNENKKVLASFSYIKEFKKDTILYYESEISNNLFFLVNGLIKIFKMDKYDNEIFLYHIYSNSMISELSSLDSKEIRCYSNAEFTENSTILSINFDKFKEHFLSKNILTIQLVQTLLGKTHQLQCLVNRELVFDSTAKVAFMLYNDLEMFNKLKRQEVSFMLHIQPETLSRVIKKLTRSDAIEVNNGEVSIIDHEQLISVFKGIAI